MDEMEYLLNLPENTKRLVEAVAELQKETVKVLFFGAVADKLGKRSTDVQAGLPLSELIQQLECTDIQPLLVAVNQEQTHDMDYVVKDGDEVALMPLFSGG